MNDLPLIVPVNKFFLIRNRIWYEISKHDFKELIKLNSPCRHQTLLTMDAYYIDDSYNIYHTKDPYILIHQFYSLKSVRWFDLEFDFIMYGVTYGKT